MLELVWQLKGLESGEEGLAFGGDIELDLDSGADVHAGEVGDEDLGARVAFGGGVPARIHDVDFAFGDFLALAGLGGHDPAGEADLLAGGVVFDLDLRLPDLAGIGQDLLGIADAIDGAVGVGDLQFLAAFKDFRVGLDCRVPGVLGRVGGAGRDLRRERQDRGLPGVVLEVLQSPLELEGTARVKTRPP